jgi:arginine vasopressin receptor 1B
MNSSDNLTHPILHTDPFMTQIETISMSILFLLTVVGNAGCILVLLFCQRSNNGSRKISRMSFYIINLSIADLSVAFLSILPTLFWRYNVYFSLKSNTLCKLVSFFGIFPIYISTFSLLLMAYDRYKAICKPFKTYLWTHKRAFIAIALLWILAACVSSPQLYLFSLNEMNIEAINKTVETCSVRWPKKSYEISYVLFHTFTQFVVPLILLCFFYISIFVTVTKSISLKNESQQKNSAPEVKQRFLSAQLSTSSARKLPNSEKLEVITPILGRKNELRQNTSTKTLTRAKFKTLKLTLSVVIAYFLCCLPFYISVTTHVIIASENYSKTHGKFIRKLIILVSNNNK